MGIKVKIETTKGDIILELNDEKAPITVENFLNYVDKKFFDGTIFHRVIADFMIQGGGMEPGLNEKETDAPIQNEADNGLANARGTIAMARTQVVDSATAQFFINLKDNHFLNFKSADAQGFGYAVFGKVIEGIEVVDEIAKVKTGSYGYHQDVPKEDIVMKSVTRV